MKTDAGRKASFGVSGNFGGRDAARIALPHFHALKAAARSSRLRDFPFPELAFILRVDGEIRQFGLSGAGNLDVDRRGEYVSVDIGVTLDDRAHLEETIAAAILASCDVLRRSGDKRLVGVKLDLLTEDLAAFVAAYRACSNAP